METYRPPVGTSIDDLDTPCLLLDLAAVEHNMNVVAETYRDTICKMRAHTKNLKTPVLAHMQIKTGGTVGGVCVAKVAEAEVMVEGGIEDIFITNQVVSEDKIVRLCSLAAKADMRVAIDNPENLRLLSKNASNDGVTVGVVIEVDTSMHRAGIRTVEAGVELAQLSQSLPGIAFKGVMSHQTVLGDLDRETRYIEGRHFMQMCIDMKEAIETVGIPVEVVSTGETWTFDVAADIPGVTEVQGGTYALMSNQYSYMEMFQTGVKVLGTVISVPRFGVAIGDVGYRALASPGGVLPSLEGHPEVSVDSLHEEHIVLRSQGSMPLSVGAKFLLYSGQQDMLVNRWDQFVAVRNGMVEAVWDIPARGCHH